MFKDIKFLHEKFRLNVERLLYAIVFTLIFEGLTRKIFPPLGLLIFFLKDILCILGLIFIFTSYAKSNITNNPFYNSRKFFFVALIPVLINTNFKDPLLALFGLKQYMLYIVIGLLVPLAFTPDKIARFKKFIFYIALTILPTTFVAVLQNSLSGEHWLNRSVDGGSLDAFGAGGILRVSSTFAFTGQYSWFLNIACVILVVNFCLPIKSFSNLQRRLLSILPIFISINFIIGAFITGGRSAVLGSGVIIFLGFLLAVLKSPQKIITRGIVLIVVLGASLTVLRAVKPEYFLVYDIRSEDKKEETHAEEVEGRVIKDLFGWTYWIADQDVVSFLFGNGLGGMSNGAEKISSYIQDVRNAGISTESEIDTIAWEGGVYLVLIFFGLRLWIIFNCFKIWLRLKNSNYSIAVSFLLGFIIVVGLYGNLSRQPPISIWFWLAIGCITAIYNFDKYNIMHDSRGIKSNTFINFQ